MSMLVEISEQARMHNGQVVKVGQCVKLPNSMALAMLKKGHAIKPTAAQQREAGEQRSKARAAGKAARTQSKKGKR